MRLRIFSCNLILFISSSASAALPGWSWSELAAPNEVSQNGDFVRFDIRSSVSKGIRQEIVYQTRALPSDARRFELLLRLPATSLAPDFKSITLARWNENIPAGGKRPPFSLRLRGGHLVATIWNDAQFAKDAEADGLVVLDYLLRADQWYRVSGCLQFDPSLGKARVEIRKCTGAGDCSARVPVLKYAGQPGVGFSESKDYAFRVGVYSSSPLPASKQFVVDDRLSSDAVKAMQDCSNE